MLYAVQYNCTLDLQYNWATVSKKEKNLQNLLVKISHDAYPQFPVTLSLKYFPWHCLFNISRDTSCPLTISHCIYSCIVLLVAASLLDKEKLELEGNSKLWKFVRVIKLNFSDKLEKTRTCGSQTINSHIHCLPSPSPLFIFVWKDKKGKPNYKIFILFLISINVLA